MCACAGRRFLGTVNKTEGTKYAGHEYKELPCSKKKSEGTNKMFYYVNPMLFKSHRLFLRELSIIFQEQVMSHGRKHSSEREILAAEIWWNIPQGRAYMN